MALEVWLRHGSGLRSLVHHSYSCCQRSSHSGFLSLLLSSSHSLLWKAVITWVLLYTKNRACSPKLTRLQSIHNNWHVSLCAWSRPLIGKHIIIPLLLSLQLIYPLFEFSMLLIQLCFLLFEHDNLLHQHVVIVFLTFEFNLKLIPFF